MSFRGKAFTCFTWKTQNINPIAHPDCIAKMKKMQKAYINDKTPRGCTLRRFCTANGTRYEIVTRNNTKPEKYIYYLHGGAYITGLLSMYRSFVMGLSDNTAAVLLDYSLAPEHRYPVQLNEAVEIWDELTLKRKITAKNIIVGGDSSGGNLALALLHKLKDSGKELPCGCFLLSPWTDMLMTGKSYAKNYGRDAQLGEKRGVMTEEKRQALMNSDLFCCLEKNEDRHAAYVSPLYGSFEKFPPCFFSVGDDEMLLDDSLATAQKMKKAGVMVTMERQKNMFHTYILCMNTMPESKVSYGRLKAFIAGLV